MIPEQKLWEEFYKNGYERITKSEMLYKNIVRPYKEFLEKSSVVLDVGCGPGYTTLFLKKSCGKRGWFKKSDVSAYGIDISPTAIQEAQRMFKDITFKVCDGKTIPFENHFFDFIFMHSVTVHIPRRFTESYIREFRRVLKPGGVALVQFVSFPCLDDIEDNPILYTAFGPEPHIGWPLKKTFNLILLSGMGLESIIAHKIGVYNPALEGFGNYWVLLRKRVGKSNLDDSGISEEPRPVLQRGFGFLKLIMPHPAKKLRKE